MTEEAETYIAGSVIQPQKYNIVLTKDGSEVEFAFPPATPEEIVRFGYIQPNDQRCNPGLITAEEDLYQTLAPVLGSTFTGNLAYHTRKQTIITLHETAILGYQRQTIIDPRISNEVALFWEIYLDSRVFHTANDLDWQLLMAEVIVTERTNPDADQALAEDIKDILLRDARDAEADD